MKPHQDAVGREFLDFHRGKPSYEIVERDDGYVEPTPGVKSYFSEYRNWPPDERAAIGYARGHVLDIGCGAGRHSLYLQKRGLRILPIDVSPLAVKVCRLRGLRSSRVMSITRIPPTLGPFDTLLMLGHNFGLFGSFERARWLLRKFRGITTDRARIIAQTVDPYDTQNPWHLRYHRRNRRRGRMPGQIRLRVRYQGYATPWFDYLFVSKSEMKRILAGSGWKVKRFIDFKGPVYVAIIEKE
ncbi:MAG: class I SAM-dependent methyltransferase [Candidatus Eiseniibacteriota bacterium]|nr:MAG: class I SAM-dependent methyltransferase [Candidatus Eisenbacteria bacterium]